MAPDTEVRGTIFFFPLQVESPSPDTTPPEGHAGPVDSVKQDVLKVEAVEVTVSDSGSGITLLSFLTPSPLPVYSLVECASIIPVRLFL